MIIIEQLIEKVPVFEAVVHNLKVSEKIEKLRKLE